MGVLIIIPSWCFYGIPNFTGTKLLVPPHKVSFVYDPRMMEHKNYEDRCVLNHEPYNFY